MLRTMFSRRFPGWKSIFLVLSLWIIGMTISARAQSSRDTSSVEPLRIRAESHFTLEAVPVDAGQQLLNALSSIRTVFQDRQGFLWYPFVTKLIKYDGYRFKVYDPEKQTTVNTTDFWSIDGDLEGDLWFASLRGGLIRFEHQTEQFIAYQHDPENPQSLSSNEAWVVYVDRAGEIWIGAWGAGLNHYDREHDQFIRYQHDPQNPESLSHNVVNAIYEDRSGRLWIWTAGGLNCFDREEERFFRYTHHPDDPTSLSHPNITAIHEDQAGKLWIGTGKGGLNHFDPVTEQAVHYRHDPNNPHSLSSDKVSTVYEINISV